jgi:hypothetical protein
MERAFLRRLVSLRWHLNCGGGHGGRRSLAELGDVQVGGGSSVEKLASFALMNSGCMKILITPGGLYFPVAPSPLTNHSPVT